jgi:predicted RNA-binding protein with PIN domain
MPYWFDGNNLIGQSAAAAKEQPGIRQAFLSTLSSYRTSRGGRFLVYFDGDDSGNSFSPPGVGVRYSAPLSTDEAILRRLNEVQNPSEIIVVTNDRELMFRCRNAGATTLDWREFDAKMNAGPTRRGGRSEPKDPIDVEEWIRYFGLDKKDV